jgi:hypothetical protein
MGVYIVQSTINITTHEKDYYWAKDRRMGGGDRAKKILPYRDLCDLRRAKGVSHNLPKVPRGPNADYENVLSSVIFIIKCTCLCYIYDM